MSRPFSLCKEPLTVAKKRAARKKKTDDAAANLGFESKLWLAADKLRNNMDAAEYKHVVLGLIFLKYISDAFEELHEKLIAGEGDYQGATHRFARAVPVPVAS